MNETDPGFETEEQLSELFDESVTADIVSLADQGETRISVCHMNYVRTEHQPNDSEHSRTARQTAVLFAANDLDVPTFHLQPRIKGLFGKLFSSLGATANLKFADSPQFEEHYILMALNEPACRALFTTQLRNHLETAEGWEIRGHGKLLVIAKFRQIIPDNQIDTFTTDALAILSLLRQGESVLDSQPQIHRNIKAEDLTAAASRMDGVAGGIVGRILHKTLLKLKVTSSEVQEFLAAEPPRIIPSGMKKQVVGDIGPLIIAGIVLTIVGIGGAIATFIYAEGWNRLTGLLFVPAAIGGFFLAYLPWKSEIQKCRCLKSGKKVHAKIVKVIRTDTSINDQRRYQVKVEYESEGTPKIVRVNAYGNAVDKAKAFKESGESVVILVDTENTSIAVCPDLLTIFE